MNPFKRDEAPFLVDVHKHAGRFRGVHGGTMSCWEVKNTMLEPFGDINKAVCTELDNCRFPRSMVVMFDLFLRGSSPDSAEVYVMVAGATEQHRKKAVKRLRKSSLTKNYPGLKMDHWDWPPDAPQVVMMGSDGDNPSWTTVHRSQGYEIRFSGKAPEGDPMDKLGHISYHIVATDRGSSGDNTDVTSASRKNSNSELLSITKLGASDEKSGVLSHYVMAGGKRYLLAPAHIFLAKEPKEIDDFSDTDDSDSDLTSTSDTESSFDVMLRAGSATPPDLESQPASDSATDENPSDRMSVFDSSTKQKGKQPELPPSTVAPAISCARLLSIELDYVLIHAPVTLGPDPVAGLRCLMEERTASLPFQKDSEMFLSRTVERTASVTTPSQGLLTGKISTRPVMMRLPYSRKFSMLYPLELPSPVKPGDCGSAVLDRLSRVYGFIAAGSTTGNVAYVVPADDILKDIRSRLGRLSAHLLTGREPSAIELSPTAATQTLTIQEDPSEKPKISSRQLVISDLPFDADENFVRGIASGIDGLDGIAMHLSAFKATKNCRDATLSFASDTAASLAYHRLRSHGPQSYTLMPLFSVPLLEWDRSPQNMKDKQTELTSNAPPASGTPSPLPAGDFLDARRLQTTIDRLAAENEALRAKNARLSGGLSIRAIGAAAEKKVLETQTVTIKTLEQKVFALEEALRNSSNLARVSGKRVADLEIEVARHERYRRNEHGSLLPLAPAGYSLLSTPLRTTSPASPSAAKNKAEWEPPEGFSRGVTKNFFNRVVSQADFDNLEKLNIRLKDVNRGLVLENGILRVELRKLRDDREMLVENVDRLRDDLNQLNLSSLSESDLHLRPGARTAEYAGSTADSSSSCSNNSRSSGASSVGSRRSVATAASSVNGSIKSRFAYSEILEHPGATPETLQIGAAIIKDGRITITGQAEPGRRWPKTYPSGAEDSTSMVAAYRPAHRRAPRRLRPPTHVEDLVPNAAPGSSGPSSRLSSQETLYYGSSQPAPDAHRTPVLPTNSRPQPLVDLASMPPPPPINALASARDPRWRLQILSCNNCRQRKAECVIEYGNDTCVSCGLNALSCTSTGPDPVESDVPKPSGPVVAERDNP